MSIQRLNEILESTIDAINGTKDEVFEIVNHLRSEYKRLEDEHKSLQIKIKAVFNQVERLEELDKKSRMNLSHKNKNFQLFDENDMRDAYDLANGIRIELLLKREEEKNLIERRKEIEMRLKNSYEVYNKAENINKQIAVAVEYLMGNAGNIAVTVDELSKKHYLNIKILEAQEEERSRLARDIHDGPAQSLANVIVKAELCEKLLDIDKDRSKNEIHNLKEVIRWTLKDVRKIIYDLRPMSLDDLGLIPTLERYISLFEEDTGIDVILKTSGKFDDLEPVIQIAIFRIIQESLSNIRKHAKAKSASIIIEKCLSKVNVSIKDDGIGFDIEDYRQRPNVVSGGFGLMNIKERVELLNGSLHITSSLNLGTKISLFIPLDGED